MRAAVFCRLSRRLRRYHRERRLIRDSRLFDIPWYRKQYLPARSRALDPVLDYLIRGAREGADPNAFFATRCYLDRNPDVASTGINPLVHFIQFGATEYRKPHPLFDCEWYLSSYGDVAQGGWNPLAHYLHHGITEGRKPNQNVETLVGPPRRSFKSGRAQDGPESGRRSPGRTPAPRAIFISGEPQTPGHSYRVEMHADALQSAGVDVLVMPLEECPLNEDLIRQADVILLWRLAWSCDVASLFAVARRHGAKLIFDVDDLMIDPGLAKVEIVDGIRFEGLEEGTIARMYGAIQRTMLEADFCTTTTKPLASAMRRFQKTTFVLPNGFDEDRFIRSRQAVAERRQSSSDDLLRIGYAGGTRTHQKDFGRASGAVARILREHPEVGLA